MLLGRMFCKDVEMVGEILRCTNADRQMVESTWSAERNEICKSK